MNPLGLLVAGLGLFLLVVAYKGKQDNLIATVHGKAYGKSTLQ